MLCRRSASFDQHHPHIVNHRQQHLANIFGLLFLARNITDMSYLGEAFNQMGHLFAKVIANGIGIGQRVLDHVMKQSGGNRDGIEPHIGKNVGYFEGMDQVGFAGSPLLPAMFTRRKR